MLSDLSQSFCLDFGECCITKSHFMEEFVLGHSSMSVLCHPSCSSSQLTFSSAHAESMALCPDRILGTVNLAVQQD